MKRHRKNILYAIGLISMMVFFLAAAGITPSNVQAWYTTTTQTYPTTTTDTTGTTETTDTTITETTQTTETTAQETTINAPPCGGKPGYRPVDGHDGIQGNDDCCLDVDINDVCDKYEGGMTTAAPPPPPPPGTTTQETTTQQTTTMGETASTPAETQTVPATPHASPPPKTHKPSNHHRPKSPPLCKPGAVEMGECAPQGSG